LEPNNNNNKKKIPIYSSENLTKNNVVCSQLFTFRVPQKNPSAAPVARAMDLSLARHLTASHMQISPSSNAIGSLTLIYSLSKRIIWPLFH